MKRYFLFLYLLPFALNTAKAQKRVIDTATFAGWPQLCQSTSVISNDGEYSMYLLPAAANQANTLRLSANLKERHLDITGVKNTLKFSGDNKYAYFITTKDSLGIATLKTLSVQYIPGIRSFDISANGDWLAYLSKARVLRLKHTKDGKIVSYSAVGQYQFNKNGTVLLMLSASENGEKQNLTWLALNNGKTWDIWKGDNTNLGACTFDSSGQQLAFFSPQGTNQNETNAIYYYHAGMNEAERIISDTSAGLPQRCALTGERLLFSRSGDKLRFQFDLTPIVGAAPGNGYPNVMIWNYKKPGLPTESPKSDLWAVYWLNKEKIIRLNTDSEEVDQAPVFENYFLASHHTRDWYYNAEHPLISYVICADGHKNIFCKGNAANSDPYLSPDEKYVIWFDPDSLAWFSYETSTGITRNLSRDVPVPLYDPGAVAVGRRYANFSIGGWEKDGHLVYLSDAYDIWQVDPSGIRRPVNITGGYGRAHHLVFGIINNQQRGDGTISPNKNVLLSCFDPQTKGNGFWQTVGLGGKAPEELTMGPYAYYVTRTGRMGNVQKPSSFPPVKAKDANVYLVMRMTAAGYPNLYTSSDLKSFRPLSDIHPESAYNWLTTELLTWKMTDGQVSQGILYKPENFDPKKKYPLIFEYYEKRSDELNGFINPDWCYARINIPYFVSNGYLVFVPDIYYRQGHNGEGVVNAVVSAAQYLSKLPYVDSTRLGLQGHSFGGWETDYLVTHTRNLFAAACTASGVSDEVSAYDQFNYDYSIDRPIFYELDKQGSPYGLGVTPWTHPEEYEANSPVLAAGNVTTPVLMMTGDKDASVPYEQSLEFYLALRRAGKKVWLLQYKNAGHILNGGDAKDYTLRIKQFFDFYLKGKQPPQWMTEENSTSSLAPDETVKQP